MHFWQGLGVFVGVIVARLVIEAVAKARHASDMDAARARGQADFDTAVRLGAIDANGLAMPVRDAQLTAIASGGGGKGYPLTDAERVARERAARGLPPLPVVTRPKGPPPRGDRPESEVVTTLRARIVELETQLADARSRLAEKGGWTGVVVDLNYSIGERGVAVLRTGPGVELNVPLPEFEGDTWTRHPQSIDGEVARATAAAEAEVADLRAAVTQLEAQVREYRATIGALARTLGREMG